MIENGPLPKGTRIKTTKGGIHTGETHELADHLLESANRIMPNNLRFWMNGWYDLHDEIILPANAESIRAEIKP